MGPVPLHSSTVTDRAAPRSQSLVPAFAAGFAILAGFAVLLALSRSYVWTAPAAQEHYNLIVEGFRQGHLWIAKEAPPALATAANPYDFATYRPYLSAPWGETDLSYYRGRLYAYFGVTPALVLFWPYRALTGGWLHQAYAVLLFCVVGYCASVGVAVAAWKRYFPQVGAWAGAAIALVLGSVSTLPVFLVRPGLYEVSISCGFAFTMVSLAALWNSWQRPTGKLAWLAAASAAYGLAVGARPSLLFGAIILFLPSAASLAARARGAERKPWLGSFLAAFLPISAIGAGLAWYNFARFGDPLQFGTKYQFVGSSVAGVKLFATRLFWYDFRLNFTAPLRWHAGFPFVWEPVAPPVPPGHYPVEFFFGALPALPILLAAFLPLAWALGRKRDPGSPAPSAIAAVPFLLFLAAALPICFFESTASRYLLDFIPALALVCLLGVLGLHRRWAEASPRSSPLTGLLVATHAALGYSVAVGWLLALALSSFYRGAEKGGEILASGHIGEAVAHYERVCRINPDFRGSAEFMIGSALVNEGRPAEAIGFLGAATLDEPSLAAAHYNLGVAFLRQGRLAEAADSFRRAAALDPFDGQAESQLGVALFREGRVGDAIDHENAALRIEPTLEEARDNLRAFQSPAAPPGR